MTAEEYGRILAERDGPVDAEAAGTAARIVAEAVRERQDTEEAA